MKKTLLLSGALLASGIVLAQHAATYNRSVFYGMSDPLPAPGAASVSRPPFSSLQQALPGWMGNREKGTGMYRDMYGPAVTVPGSTPEQRVQHCINVILPALGIDNTPWQQTGFQSVAHAGYARFDQYYAGHRVAFARLTLRFTPDGKLLRILHYAYGAADTRLSPALPQATATDVAVQDMPGTTVTEQATGDWEWFPVPAEHGYTLRPAWPFTVAGRTEAGEELYLTGYVDALDGQLLYRENEVRETFDMTVRGGIHPQSPAQPLDTLPLPYLRVTIDNTDYYTDNAGQLNVPARNPPVTATVSLRGSWARVRSAPSNNATPSFTYSTAVNGTSYVFPVTTPSGVRHVNAYYHISRMHDYMSGFFPGFTGLNVPVTANIDVSGSCNAYYNGGSTSLNFYEEGNGCTSFALCGDIISHEYGHAIADKFYTAQIGRGMRNGGLNEGHADVWAMGITGDPIIGEGAYTGGNGLIRRYDQAPKVYPLDIRGEVHADGEIIAGAWWDVAVNIGSVDTMMLLFTKTFYDTPDGPNGTEGAVFHDVLISALLNDDDDNDLHNGTPHLDAIVAAFARHGIYLLAGAAVQHEEVAHQPAGTPVPVTATVQLPPDNLPLFREIKLFYRKRGAAGWDSTVMTPTAPGGLTFSGEIPAQQKSSIIDYYFTLYDYSGNANAFAPEGYSPALSATQSTIPYQFGVGLVARSVTDFETPATGWQIGNNPDDNATSGIWIQAVPVGSYVNGATGGALPCQVAEDHTLGDGTGQCLVTGNAVTTSASVNSADVDNGATTVITPVFDLSKYRNPFIAYYRWYANDRGSNARSDIWQVQIKDSNAPLWLFSVENTYQADYSWRRRIFAVKEFLPNSRSVQLRFIAADRINNALPNAGQSTVEAAVDDFVIYDEEDPASVAAADAVHADIYPNPADQQLYIVLRGHTAAGHAGLYDLTGRMVEQVALTPAVTGYTLHTAGLPAGQYLLMIQAGKTIQVKKVGVLHR